MKINKRKVFFFSFLVITISSIFLLFTGSSLLTKAVDNANSIPLGTFITWSGMIALPLSIYWGIEELRNPSKKQNSILSKFLKIIIFYAVLWFPISYLLAGNLSFSFSEKTTFQGGQIAMKCFWYLSYGIAFGSILTITIYWISLLFKNKLE